MSIVMKYIAIPVLLITLLTPSVEPGGDRDNDGSRQVDQNGVSTSGRRPTSRIPLEELVLKQSGDLESLSQQFLWLQDHVNEQSKELQELKESRQALKQEVSRQSGEITGLRKEIEDQSRDIHELRDRNQRLEDKVELQHQQSLHLRDNRHEQHSVVGPHRESQQRETLHRADQSSAGNQHPSDQSLPNDLRDPYLTRNGSAADLGLPSSPFKRSDDTNPLEPVISQMTQQLMQVTSDIQALKNTNDLQDAARGMTYIRWGHEACPGSAELVYSGILAGSHSARSGGPANHLCLTEHPIYDNHAVPSADGHTGIFGTEYQVCPEPQCQTTPACAVCRVARTSTVMIPGTNTCTPGWTLEYSGYIMAGYDSSVASSEYICVDSSRGYLPASQSNDNQNTIFYVISGCGALPCPPYQEGKIVSCVVCSK